MSNVIFDNWRDVVDCNTCTSYWDNSCDGVRTPEHRYRCTSYTATRSVVIPKQIKALQRNVVLLGIADVILLIILIGGIVL
jgi:hypothetical protein